MPRMQKAQNSSQKTALHIGWGIVILLAGFWLLFGAYVSLSSGAWPIFMPAQMDLFGALLGNYIGGAVAFMLGAFLVWAGLVFIWRKK